MKRIKILNFKGIRSLEELSLYKKEECEKENNLLLYAENGGGKLRFLRLLD